MHRLGPDLAVLPGVQGKGSGKPFLGQTNASPTFTHDLLLTSVPIVTIGGVQHREFLLDMNQLGGQPASLPRQREDFPPHPLYNPFSCVV